jgi:hypothetical protein
MDAGIVRPVVLARHQLAFPDKGLLLNPKESYDLTHGELQQPIMGKLISDSKPFRPLNGSLMPDKLTRRPSHAQLGRVNSQSISGRLG